MQTVERWATGADLTEGVAERLMARLVELQSQTDAPVHLCLTGGRIANRIYDAFADLVEGSDLDPTRIELWWGDERFVPTEDSDRNAGHTLAILARTLPLTSARTHSMAAADGIADADASALTYAKELGDTTFDICLLGLGEDGHVASIFPGHPSFAETTHTVIGVNDSPKPPSSRISLTVPTLSRSREVWFLVAGAEKADAVGRAYRGDPELPGGVVRGRERTLWLVDRAAGAGIPYHECTF
ncbi:6-phosphogluconolactonase [Propioniciclava sp. MC1683]|uniref:6-phosphogluconolactonase n=1 Tax=Propioniciclava sp. MC1683 TaxID=2760309 RepID=UPI00281541A3|nr:6-phosphogluconolactonase [Propioniciclava sp. MC1683]